MSDKLIADLEDIVDDNKDNLLLMTWRCGIIMRPKENMSKIAEHGD